MLFPLITFDLIPNERADAALVEWGHWLGGCNRPFGRQSFGLEIEGELLAVAVSASTVNAHCGGYERLEVVELARLCAHPEHRDLTRPALRLWRVIAPVTWGRHFWPVRALVSYANAIRHTGDIYRFDGWRKVAEVSGGTAGTTWKRPRRVEYAPKTVWAFDLALSAPFVARRRKVAIQTEPVLESAQMSIENLGGSGAGPDADFGPVLGRQIMGAE
jgi:hypothetical protein